MNRKYDLSYFREKLSRIREIRPDISISTDIIVGFPGERDIDFQSTLDFAREMEFSKIHVFPYSKRKNTPAANFPHQVDDREKKNRAKSLIHLSEELEEAYMKKFVGKSMSVLIETSKDGYSYGHTSNYLHVKLKGIYKSDEMVLVRFQSVSYPLIFASIESEVYSNVHQGCV